MSFNKHLSQLKARKTPISEAFTKCLTQSLDTKKKRPVRLRASGLPKCSLQFLAAFIEDPYEVDEAMMDYYCSVGTTVHTHVQKWMGTSGKVFGNWKCNECGHYVEHSVKHKCPKCSSVMEYVELQVEHDVFSGHIDGLLKLPNKKFIVFDYKTTSSFNIQTRKFIPIAKHLLQVSAYGAVLTLQGFKIDSLSVLYVARDDPHLHAEYNIEYTDALHATTMEFLNKQIKGFKAARKSFKTRDYELAYKYKMCKSYNDYKNDHEKFFGMEACKLSQICFNKPMSMEYFNCL